MCSYVVLTRSYKQMENTGIEGVTSTCSEGQAVRKHPGHLSGAHLDLCRRSKPGQHTTGPWRKMKKQDRTTFLRTETTEYFPSSGKPTAAGFSKVELGLTWDILRIVLESINGLYVWIWELDCEDTWVLKNWCFWTVVLEKTLENPLDCKEIQPVHPKGDQSWVFLGKTDAEAETPILWPTHAKSWLVGKDLDAGRD